jgi:outer membrane receptor protein involved in Fe transport
LFEKLRLVYGVRVEKVDMFYTGENNTGSVKYNDQNTLDELNILPSLNTVYSINDKMNIRLAASRTVARPTFKEKSIAQIYDPITKRTFVGNIDLEQTNINNFDLRYEFYIRPTELFSVAGFAKQFDGHIEMVSFETAVDNIKPRNSGDALVYGVEFELRKAFVKSDTVMDFKTNPFMKTLASRFFLTTNFSLVQSQVDLNSVLVNNAGKTEYELRQSYAREGETINETRAMAGQSPYAVNVVLSYKLSKKNGNVSLAYNVQGEQLTIIASGRVPDIYTIPFHSLNFNAYEFFGKKKQHKVTLSVNNIMDEDRTLVYRSHGSEDKIFTSYKPGLSVGLKYGFTF